MSGIELVEAARLARDLRRRDAAPRHRPELRAHRRTPRHGSTTLLAEQLSQKYSPFPGPFSRGVVACTGNEFCRFAVVETKERAVTWARWLDSQLATESVERPAPGR